MRTTLAATINIVCNIRDRGHRTEFLLLIDNWIISFNRVVTSVYYLLTTNKYTQLCACVCLCVCVCVLTYVIAETSVLYLQNP